MQSCAGSLAAPAAPLSPEGEAALWLRWREQGDAAARAALIEHYLPYARMLAAVSFKSRYHDGVEFADYQQLACIGLMEAVDRYQPDQGAHFRTYATHRIRGAILSGLERFTETAQQSALRTRLERDRLEAAVESAGLAQQGVQEPASPAGAGRSAQDLLACLAEVGIGLALGVLLEGTGMIGSGEPEDAPQDLSPEVIYFRKREQQHWQALLRDLVQRLPEQERRVIRCHYLHGMPFDEVACLLEVSRSRISQLHRRGLARLRDALAQAPPCDVAW
ncbi:sigma-70 family RNA polymerase sigma factor [Paracidovorax avenae]